MIKSHSSADAPILAYATPSARRGRPVFGAIVAMLGVAAGLFGTLMLFYGVPGIPYVFFHDNKVDFPGDLFELIMFLVIGVFCLYVAFRWCRAARRIFSGR